MVGANSGAIGANNFTKLYHTIAEKCRPKSRITQTGAEITEALLHLTALNKVIKCGLKCLNIKLKIEIKFRYCREIGTVKSNYLIITVLL